MYEWDREEAEDRLKVNSVVSELGGLRTFAWGANDLFACGLATGRTILLRLDSSSLSHPTLSTQITTRHARPCNIVSFSTERRDWLVVGLDKARGDSLLVYDIESSARALAGGGGKSEDPRPVASLGTSETVSSAAFLPGSILLASVGGKSIRGFDLRAPGGGGVASYSTRALFGLTANPFNSHQFASFAEEGVIKIWDIRKAVDAVLSFSEPDAGATGSKIRSTSPKSIAEINWNPSRPGILASLEVDSTNIRVWHLADGCEAGKGDEDGLESPQVSSTAPFRLPVLLYDQSPPHFRSPLSSFAFAISPNPDSPSSTSFVGLSREGGNPGTSGHRLEILPMVDSPSSSFFEHGVAISSHPTLLKKVVIPSPALADETRPLVASTSKLPHEEYPGRPIGVEYLHKDRNETPRPSSGTRHASRVRGERISSENMTEEFVRGMAALGKDPSVLVRDNVTRGYGSNALVNASLFDSPLSDFWMWIHRAETLAPEACVGNFDLRFAGVLGILTGPSSSIAGGPTKGERALRGEDDARKYQDSQFASASAALVSRRRLESIFAISSSSMLAQRKLALHSIGPQYEEDFKIVCQRLQQQGDHEGAARHAMLCGHLETAMTCLRACEDENLRLLAPIIAAYLSTKEFTPGSNSGVYADLCRSLSSDGESPWIRATFGLIASGGDWREVIDESGLTMSERVAVALRFLSDSELLPCLRDLATESLSDGDLSSVLLVGLRIPESLALLQSYLNRTGDIQTVALGVSFVSPGLISTRRIDRWISEYRRMLDQMRLYIPRALLDSSIGRRGRQFAEQDRLEGNEANASHVEDALLKATPPSLLLRCIFCSVNVSGNAGHGNRLAGGLKKKTTICPNCSKSLPSCSICLRSTGLETSSDTATSICVCLRCRHGGHVQHLLNWFERTEECAVAGCDCACSSTTR